MRKKGFTVPEVLAVVAIIVIILSILLPALWKMKVPAYQAMCANNNRQLLEATIAYSVDNSSWMPFNNWGSQEWGGSWNGNKGWLYHHADGGGYVTGAQRKGALWPYLKEDNIYRCPQDAPPYMAGSTHLITSYLMNGAYSSFGGNPTTIFKRFRFNSDAIMFWEVDSNAAAGYYNDGSSFPDEAVTQRHLTGLTVGSHDGHTEWFTYARYWEEVGKSPGRLWCNPLTTNGR
jgi:prepilin-type N-terminal cleavage/methylation domain-containing protein